MIVGVSALIVVMGVMNGLQRDLREKILIGSPDIRVLPYGEDLRMNDWRTVLERVKKVDGVVAAAPFVLTQGDLRGSELQRRDLHRGIEPSGRSEAGVTSIRQHVTSGDFRFATSTDSARRGARTPARGPVKPIGDTIGSIR